MESIDEYAKYFPQFIWVLRDFSLQLIDEYGDEITSNQYLENSLEHHDGFGADIELKNKIRHLIKCFFQKRACFALVRPLTSEDGLNKLNERKLENLRPEFVEEALKLRNSVLLNAKIKRIEDKEVNGEIIGGILKAYIDTINNGVIPNIENTWTYVTQSQATKLLDKCIQEFRQMMSNKLRKTLPTETRILKENLALFRAEVLRNFRESSFLKADENTQYENTLLAKIKDEKKNLYAENECEFDQLLSTAMGSSYKENIYSAVIGDKLNDIKELTTLLKNFKSTFEGIEPDGPRKLERVYKFLFAKSCEAFTILFSNVQAKLADKISEKNRELKLIQEQHEEEIKQMGLQHAEHECKIKDSHINLQELAFENEKLKESLKFVKDEMLALENESVTRRDEEKAVFRKKQDDLIRRIDENAKTYKELEAKFIKQKSEFEIEHALLNQKIEFYGNVERDLNDQKARLVSRQKQLEEEFNSRMNKVVVDYEQRLKEKADEIKNLKDNTNAIEDELKYKQTYNESMCSEFIDKEDDLRDRIRDQDKTISELKAQVQDCQNLNAAQTFQEKQLIDQTKKLEGHIKGMEDRLKEREEKIATLSTSLDTLLAVEKQKVQFLDLKVSELTMENEDLKKRKDSNFQMLEMKNLPKIDLNQQLQDVRSNYEDRLRKLAADFDAEKEDVTRQLTKQLEEADDKIKELKSEKEVLFAAKLSLTQGSESSKLKIKTLEEKVTFLENSQSKSLQERFALFEETIRKLNLEKDLLVLQKEEEQEKSKRIFDENLMNMQMVFDTEKNRLDKKLTEEKVKYEMLLSENAEEFERRRSEELAQLEEENQYLSSEYQNLELKSKSTVQKLENEVANFKAKLEIAEKRVADLTTAIEKDLASEKNKLKYTIASYEQEKMLQNEKLNTLKNEISGKNLEVFQLKQQIESANTALTKLGSEKSKEIDHLNTEVSDLASRLEGLVLEKNGLNEDLINTKINLNKDLALKTHKIEFLENKISDLNNNFDYLQKESDDKIRSIKAEAELEKENINKAKRDEIAIWESRYEEKKKALKEIEGMFTAKINELEKNKYMLQEKLSGSEAKRDELEKRCQNEALRFELDFKKLKDSYLNERKEIIAEIDMHRKEKYELEISLAETHAKLDKDKAVFESKVAFLEQQNRKLKNDLTDSQNSFDSMFQKFHQFRVSDKEETENSHTSYIISLEQRYNAQIQDLKEQHKSMIDSLKEKIKSCEKEIKRLEQINTEHMNSRHGSGLYQEKKISEMLENEKALQDELIRIKSMSEKSSLQFQKEFEKEREGFKKRLLDQELKMKRLETEKNLMIFEQEKQKTKWNIEKDHLISSKTEFLESLDRLKKQKEQLNRENEKLKADLRLVKKTNLGNSLFTFVKNKGDLLSGDKSNRSSTEYFGGDQKASQAFKEEYDDE